MLINTNGLLIVSLLFSRGTGVGKCPYSIIVVKSKMSYRAPIIYLHPNAIKKEENLIEF